VSPTYSPEGRPIADVCQITRADDPRIEEDAPSPDFNAPGSHIFHNGPDLDSDPEEGDIEEHIRHAPGGIFMHQRIFGSPALLPDGRPRSPGTSQPADPHDPGAVFRRFTEMLMQDFRAGQTGRSGPDTLFPPEEDGSFATPSRFQTTRTTFSGSGYSSFTIAAGPIPARPGGGRGANPANFAAYGSRLRGPPGITVVSFRNRANAPHRTLDNIMGGIPLPGARDEAHRNAPGHAGGLPPGFPHTLHQILASLLNPAGAVHGDAVYTQEALDRIISGLMEANPQSNAAPPASQSAIDGLEKKVVDEEMLGGDGKAECTICISEAEKGDEVVALPCKHWFHGECVAMWLRQHNTCPVCRSPIEGDGGGSSSSTAPPPAPADMPGSAPPEFDSIWGRPNPPEFDGIWGRSRPSPQERPDRVMRTAEENQERLYAIRNLAAATSTQDTPSRDRDLRRSSYSPPAAHLYSYSEQASRARQRSPSPGARRGGPFGRNRDRDQDRDRDRNASEQGSRRSSNSGNAQGHGLFGFLRNQFSRNSGNDSSGGRRP